MRSEPNAKILRGSGQFSQCKNPFLLKVGVSLNTVWPNNFFSLPWVAWTTSIYRNCIWTAEKPWGKRAALSQYSNSVWWLPHLGEVVVVSQAELWDADLYWIYDGEAAVSVLLRDHHCVTALWWLWHDIAGCKNKRGCCKAWSLWRMVEQKQRNLHITLWVGAHTWFIFKWWKKKTCTDKQPETTSPIWCI